MERRLKHFKTFTFVGKTPEHTARIVTPGTIVDQDTGEVIYATTPKTALGKIALNQMGVLPHMTGEFVASGEHIGEAFLG